MHRVCFTLLVVLALPGTASAGSILFGGSGTSNEADAKISLSAGALFDVTGSTLTITLRNRGDSSGTGTDVPGNLLTGVFFDLPSNIKLVPYAVTVDPGAILNPTLCEVDCLSETHVGGEFAYNKKSWGSGNPAGDHGIAASGYIDKARSNFQIGENLHDPNNPDGPNFGITPEVDLANPFIPNGGLSAVPLIEEKVVITMTITDLNGNPYGGLSGLDLANVISNVSFQYGTSFGQTRLPGSFNPPSMPEPGLLLLLAPAVAAAVARRRMRRRQG